MSNVPSGNVKESGIKLLAAAIILQAAEDYGNALLGNHVVPGLRGKPENMIRECENFFRNDYYEAICPIKLSGEDVIKSIRKQITSWPKNKKFILYKTENKEDGEETE